MWLLRYLLVALGWLSQTKSKWLPFGFSVPGITCTVNTPGIINTLIARFMGPPWGPSGVDRTQVGPMLAPWILLSGQSWLFLALHTQCLPLALHTQCCPEFTYIVHALGYYMHTAYPGITRLCRYCMHSACALELDAQWLPLVGIMANDVIMRQCKGSYLSVI